MQLETIWMVAAAAAACAAPVVAAVVVFSDAEDMTGAAAEVVALEKAALERWGSGDPSGYLELTAPDASYFDPSLERRIDGLAGITAHYRPVTGTIHVDRFEMIGPRVQLHGDTAVLTFNLVDWTAREGGGEEGGSRWHSTEVYFRVDGRWRLVHSHWSRPSGPPSS